MYDQFATDYDRFNNWENRLAYELPFIEDRLKSFNARYVLDAACGTGMHAIALAGHGFSLYGTDISEPMIDQARKNALTQNIGVAFETAGFGRLAGVFKEKVFDAVLCLGNSLPHILTRGDLKIVLVDFTNCLKPGGLLLIQNRNYDLIMADRQRWMEPQTFMDKNYEYLFQRFYDFENDGTIRFNIVTLKRPLGGEWQVSAAGTRLAPQKETDLRRMLEEAGFVDIQTYGSMTGEVFDRSTSGNLILVAQKRLNPA
jgi:ubiquinone/menaquinone biosynthesis C-methylase UbiE